MTNRTGGPAFPQHGWSKDPEVIVRMQEQGGMTLRDWFAGQAMTTLNSDNFDSFDQMASEAYSIAASMVEKKWKREGVPQSSPSEENEAEIQRLFANQKELQARLALWEWLTEFRCTVWLSACAPEDKPRWCVSDVDLCVIGLGDTPEHAIVDAKETIKATLTIMKGGAE